MGLPGAVVGILPDDDHLHLAAGGEPQGVKKIIHGRIDRLGAVFLL